ncbi:MAG TPA: hypothetical protein VGG19_04465 [Tepidisphaeraceae bacterium]|jgi:hypothetical protein
MGIFQTFSKREKAKRQAGQADVYQYDVLPPAFRVQVVHILKEVIGEWTDFPRDSTENNAWGYIRDTLARERGVFFLHNQYENPYVDCANFILSGDVPGCLDLIELSFRCVDRYIRERRNTRSDCDASILELNYRFQEHAVGYQFQSGEIIKVDSQFVHAEIVKPALVLLSAPDFEGAQEEFLKAHNHYRHNRYKEAITEAEKAFESTMRVICDLRRYTVSQNATASKLIDVLVQNGVIPAELTSEFTSLQSLLQSGLPTVRNKKAGHGQGGIPVDVPDYLAAFALHVAAANIVFLVQAHQA